MNSFETSGYPSRSQTPFRVDFFISFISALYSALNFFRLSRRSIETLKCLRSSSISAIEISLPPAVPLRTSDFALYPKASDKAPDFSAHLKLSRLSVSRAESMMISPVAPLSAASIFLLTFMILTLGAEELMAYRPFP
ncbi:MAG: hypothetical protein ACD_47C00018G0001 [uncultured bacterium]|nr:MAG: hypothetical protein ACD_47C00018G0001 [uncultured bacterium]